jgi:hypothetical protein
MTRVWRDERFARVCGFVGQAFAEFRVGAGRFLIQRIQLRLCCGAVHCLRAYNHCKMGASIKNRFSYTALQ